MPIGFRGENLTNITKKLKTFFLKKNTEIFTNSISSTILLYIYYQFYLFFSLMYTLAIFSYILYIKILINLIYIGFIDI